MTWTLLGFAVLVGYDMLLTEQRIRRLTRQIRWERERRAVLEREGVEAFLHSQPFE